MPTPNLAPLVQLVGFLTGAALYALLLTVAARRGSTDRLPLLTAILGLVWNVSGLASFGLRDFAGEEPSPWLLATAYSALGFLPAVVVHSVLRTEERRRSRALTAVVSVAYAVSGIACVLMFDSGRGHRVPSSAALQMLTWSYAALAVPVLLLTRRRRDWARGGSVVALALFAVSALHLSHHDGSGSLAVELIGHHASIPLIFAILYQDFRFALADVFLKRALTLFATISIAAAAYFGIAVPVFAVHDFRSDPVAAAVAIVLFIATAMLYPHLAKGSAWFVDRVVLRRADYARVRDQVALQVAAAESAEDVLDVACAAIAFALSAGDASWTEGDDGDVFVPTAAPPRYAIRVGTLASGRQLLSGDSELLNAVALLSARRIDAIRLAQISKLATEAELRALRAQVNPHFLFNALNTIGYLIQTSPTRAHLTLLKLTALLRGVLRSTGTAVTIGDEIDLVTAYLEIESARFEERLQVVVEIPSSLRQFRIPPLTIQPLVENAIKHGVARSRAGGEVRVEARRTLEFVIVTVTNTGAAASEFEIAQGRRRGLGLANIEQRLHHYYGSAARLTLCSGAAGTIAELLVPIDAVRTA